MEKEKKNKYRKFFEAFKDLCPMTDEEFEELVEEMEDYRNNELYNL